MGRIVVSEFLSLDGVMQDPGGVGEIEHGGWTAPYWNDDLAKFKHDELFGAEGLLLGRVTYEGFAKAWPQMTDEGDYGERMNDFPKYVISRTLVDLGWNNSHLLQGNLEDEIARLRGQAGQDLLVFGSGQLVRSLIRLNLVDEIRLQVYPVVVGSGNRLFGPDKDLKAFELGEARALGPVVLLTYRAEASAK